MWFTSCRVVTFVISNSQRFWCVDQLVGGRRSDSTWPSLCYLHWYRQGEAKKCYRHLLKCWGQRKWIKQDHEAETVSQSLSGTPSHTISLHSRCICKAICNSSYSMEYWGESQEKLVLYRNSYQDSCRPAPAGNNYIKFSCILPLLTVQYHYLPFCAILCLMMTTPFTSFTCSGM